MSTFSDKMQNITCVSLGFGPLVGWNRQLGCVDRSWWIVLHMWSSIKPSVAPEEAACHLITCFKWCHLNQVAKLQCGQCTDRYSRTRDGTFIIPCILLSFLRPRCLHYPQCNLKPLELPFNEDIKFWVRVTCALLHVKQRKRKWLVL